MEYFYKVLRSENDKLVSVGGQNRLGKLCIHYKWDVWIEPPVGKIFVFDTFNRARMFRNDYKYIIVECECINPQYPIFYDIPNLNYVETDDASDFWKTCKINNFRLCSWPVPYGTVVCDAVKMIREIK